MSKAFSIADMAGGITPTVEKHVESAGGSFYFKLLSRARRRELLPDDMLQRVQELQKPIDELQARETVLNDDLATAIKAGDAELVKDNEYLIDSLRTDMRANIEKLQQYERGTLNAFLREVLTDAEGMMHTEESYDKFYNMTSERVWMDILKAAQEAVGLSGDESPGE